MYKRCLFVTSIMALFTIVASAQVTAVATGLNNPRGLAFGPGGILYVGEAGLGAGNGAGGVGFGQGFTGSVGEILDVTSANPTYRRIITGLASHADTGGVIGPDGVSPLGNGNIHIIMADSTMKVLTLYPTTSAAIAYEFGKLLQSSQSGQWKVVANVGDFDYQWAAQNKNQPWAPPPPQFPDANPYAVLSVPGHEYIADAGSNTIDEVDENGTVRIIAFVPNPIVNSAVASDSVPTCVAQGADGFLYVGTLAFGAASASHFMQPESKVYRIDPTLSNAILTDSDVWASGFYPITGCGFGPGAFYVTEYFTAKPFSPPGALVKVALNPDGSAGTRTVMGGGQLQFPNGFAAGPDGSVYVANNSTSPGVARSPGAAVGQVVRVDH